LRSAVETRSASYLKRTGDGICVAFNSPEYVIDAAVAHK
jgi:hypothetical protein